MAWMPRLELLRSDEVEQRPLVELLEQVRPDLAFPGDVDDEGTSARRSSHIAQVPSQARPRPQQASSRLCDGGLMAARPEEGKQVKT